MELLEGELPSGLLVGSAASPEDELLAGVCGLDSLEDGLLVGVDEVG